jgi:tetratricopeptide (TPR) repeat protein
MNFSEVSSNWGVASTDVLRAWILLDKGELEQSKKYYEKYYNYRASYSPQYLANYKADRAYYLGLKYLKQNRPDSARLSLNEIKTLYSQLTPIGKERHDYKKQYLYIRILLKQDSLSRAEMIAQKLEPMETPFGFYWNYLVYNFPLSQDQLAQAYLKKGKLNQAIAEYQRLTETHPQKREWKLINPIYHYRLAQLYEEKKLLQKAIAEYKKFVEICGGVGDESAEMQDTCNRLAALVQNIGKAN